MTTTLETRVNIDDAIRFRELAKRLGVPQREVLRRALDALEREMMPEKSDGGIL